MTIIITIPWFHPAYKAGGPIQSIANMVDQFSDKVSFKILTSNTDLNNSVISVDTNKWSVYNWNISVYYATKNKLSFKLLNSEIKRVAPDILFINGIYSWYFNLLPMIFVTSTKKIVSVRGMLHPGALSQKALKKKVYLSIWKILGLHKKCDFHASNIEEKKYIQNVFGEKVKVHIAQNFPRVFTFKKTFEKKKGFLELISIALISQMKNHLLVLKALKHCDGNIIYNIYGPIKDQSYWNLCVQEIASLPINIIVNYHGEIHPIEVEKLLVRSHVFILPSKSENFGHAIFEAFTTGTPVITSAKTPWNNLKIYNAGLNVTPENVQDLRNAIQYFAELNDIEYEKWSIGAKKYSERALNINEIREQYNVMFQL